MKRKTTARNPLTNQPNPMSQTLNDLPNDLDKIRTRITDAEAKMAEARKNGKMDEIRDRRRELGLLYRREKILEAEQERTPHTEAVEAIKERKANSGKYRL